MIKIVLLIKEDCLACNIVKKVITQAINNINCDVTFKIVNGSNINLDCYNIKIFPTTIFYKDEGSILTNVIYNEIARLEGSFPIDYLNKVIDKIKAECNE